MKRKYARIMEKIVMPGLIGSCLTAILICGLFMILDWNKAQAFKMPEIGISVLLFMAVGIPAIGTTIPDIDTGA